MEKYKLLGLKKRKSKKGNDYYICFVVLETDFDYQVLNIMIEDKQIDSINTALKDINFDISKFLKLSYNSYLKQYQLKLTLGL